MKFSLKNLFTKNDTDVINKSFTMNELPTGITQFITNGNLSINYNKLSPYQTKQLLSGIVTTCINTRAQIFAQSIPQIYRNVAGVDTRKNKIVDEHPFVNVLFNPNPLTSYYELMVQTLGNLDAWGNAYWLIQRNNINLPSGIELLDPINMKYKLNDNGYPTSFEYTTYTSNNNKKTITYSLDDIIHFKYSDLFCRNLYGISIIEQNVTSIEIYHYENEYQKNLLIKGGMPSMLLKSDIRSMKPQQIERLKEDWKSMYAGFQNAGNIPILEQGLTVEKLNFNPAEIGYLESKKISKNEILNMFRVHPAMLGDAEGVNKANGFMGKNSFLEDVIVPISKMFNAKLTQFVKKNYNTKFYFEQKLPFRLNEEQEIKRYELGLTKGCITKNEYRTFMDYDIVPILNDEDKMFFNQYTITDTTTSNEDTNKEDNSSMDSNKEEDTNTNN